jgi:maleylacetoacetate isomerase
MNTIQLYDYYRSSACYRVRIALNLKHITYEKIEIHLLHDGGVQHTPAYLHINPQGLVPALAINGALLTQSLAIIEYLDTCYPTPPLYPIEPLMRARANGIAQLIACDIHPINNLRIQNAIKTTFQASEDDCESWRHQWFKQGFDALESLLSQYASTHYCIGNAVTIADLCLIPQVHNAQRFHFDLTPYPRIQHIHNHCMTLTAFQS